MALGKNGTRKKWLPELTAPEKMAPGNNGRVPNLDSAVCTRDWEMTFTEM